MTIGDNRFATLGVNPTDLFILYPHNRGFLTGERLTPDFRPSRGIIFGTLLVALSTLITAFFLIFAVLPALIARVGTLTDGTVVRSYHTSDTRGRLVHFVEFTYRVGNNTFHVTQSINGDASVQTNSPVSVKVKYLPFAPDQATIVDASLNNSVSNSGNTLWIFGAFELIVLVVSIVGFYYAFRLWQLRRRRIAAWTTASLVVGHVVKCAGVVVTTRNRSSYQVTLTYQYQMPLSGKMITGQESNTRNDLIHGTLPSAGTPVVVVAYNQIIPPANPFRKAGSQGFVL